MSFAEYFDWYKEDIAQKMAQPVINYITSECINTNTINNYNNFLEVGVGRGILFSKIAPYFANKTFIEPNILFANHSIQRYLDENNIDAQGSSIGITSHNDLLEQTNFKHFENKFDLITMQQVLWHCQLDKWNDILFGLYNALNSNGILIVSLFKSQGLIWEIRKRFVPQIRGSEYIYDYFDTMLSANPNEFELTEFKNTENVILSESVAIQVLMEMHKCDLRIYDENLYKSSKNEIEALTKDCLKNYNTYLDEVSNAEPMVRFQLEQGHIIVHKK
eukprot:298016_1